MPVNSDDVIAALIRVVQNINPDDEGSKEDRSTLAEFLKQYVDSHPRQPEVVERSDTKEKSSASQRSR